MGANTKIEWATHTLNWWVGCEHISPLACANCYAESWAKRAGRDFAERRLTTVANRAQPFKWQYGAEAFEQEHGHRQRIFVNSLSDVFDNKAPQEWRESLFHVIRQTPALDYLLLTKRIGNAKNMLPTDWRDGFPNVWLGVTVANQAEADRDIPKLLATPARIRFLSCEPLLGPLNLRNLCIGKETALHAAWGVPAEHDHFDALHGANRARLDWVIAGGESGPKARPMHPAWVRSLRDQCSVAGVPFFFKQWGAYLASDQREARRYSYDERSSHDWGDGIDSIHLPKKATGNVLDGHTWLEFPRSSAHA